MVGLTLLGLLAVLLLLLCIPVSILLDYRTDEPPRARLCWLFLHYDLLKEEPPKKKKPQKAKPEPEKKEPQKKEKAKRSPEEFSTLLGTVLDLLSSATGALKTFIRHFRLYVRLHMTVAADDAAETALAYGRVNAGVYAAYAFAAGFLNVGKPEIEIKPDFLSERGTVDFSLRGSMVPIIAAGAGLRAGWTFLLKTIKRRRAESADKGSNQKQK